MMGRLAIARHQESAWNKLGKWTGSVNIGLSSEGFEESRAMGRLIGDLNISQAFASAQIRSLETLLCMEDGICLDVPVTRNAALNERDYGEYTGKNKWDMEKLLGETEFLKLRREWDYPVPGGESLKMVYERVVPYYTSHIVPALASGANVLIVAHGNSLRALIKYIESVADVDMVHTEMPFETVIVYDVDETGKMKRKQVRSLEKIAHKQ
ncbi:MAG TPA: histidine phosphatase family protein [Candidatus Paceibacterota bacterium]